MQGKECCKDAEQCIVDLQPPLLQANPVGLSISANIQQSNMENISRIGISNLPNQTAPCPAMPSHAQPCPALSSPSRDPSPAHSSGSLQRRPGTVSTVGTVGTVELQRPGRPAARPPGLELRKCVRKFAVPGKTSDMGRRCKICKTGKIQRNGEISPLISPVKEINCQ